MSSYFYLKVGSFLGYPVQYSETYGFQMKLLSEERGEGGGGG